MAEIIAFTEKGAQQLEEFADNIIKSIDTIGQECDNFEKKMMHYTYVDNFGENIIEENKKVIGTLDGLTEDMRDLAKKMKDKADDIRKIARVTR